MIKGLQDRLEKLEKLFEGMDGKLDLVLEALLSLDGSASESAQPAIVEPSAGLIEVRCEEAPWIIEARNWINFNEIDDEEALTKYLGINPNDDDEDGLPWCAYFVGAVYGACGIARLNTGLAVDYQNHGYKLNQPIDGCLAVFDAGQVKGGHVGWVTQNGTKILGGNQGDSVRENNLNWYLQKKTLVGYYCPPGYKLVA